MFDFLYDLWQAPYKVRRPANVYPHSSTKQQARYRRQVERGQIGNAKCIEDNMKFATGWPLMDYKEMQSACAVFAAIGYPGGDPESLTSRGFKKRQRAKWGH